MRQQNYIATTKTKIKVHILKDTFSHTVNCTYYL